MSARQRSKRFLFAFTLIFCMLTATFPGFAKDDTIYRDVYTVKRGDTLYSIALMYNTTRPQIYVCGV